MALNGKTEILSSGMSPVCSICPTPEVLPLERYSISSESLNNFSLRNGIIVPNRVFIGGFEHMVSNSDLWHMFSKYGPLKEVNVVQNPNRLTKGYGFVTFENAEDAQSLLLDANEIFFKDKKLSIRQAIRKHSSSNSIRRRYRSERLQQVPCGSVFLTTSSGFPYTFHNGVAYFHGPRVSSAPQHWSHPPAPVVMPQSVQPVYYQQNYHHQHHQPRYFPNHCQWNNVEVPVSSGSVIYAQAEYMHHVPDGAALHQRSVPLMDNYSAELYDPVIHDGYTMFPHRERIPCFVPSHGYGKNHVDPCLQVVTSQTFTHSSSDPPTAPEQPALQEPQSAQ